MKRTKKLPKKIFVYWDGDDPQFLNAAETPLGITDGTAVGIYELETTKTQTVTEELV